jgi:hypothetical protein
MERSNKELIKEITDLFEDYEESYVPGEWESFQKNQKKKYPFFAPWLKIAAVLLLIVSVLPYGVNKLLRNKGNGSAGNKQQTVAGLKPAGQKPAARNSSDAAVSAGTAADQSAEQDNGNLKTAALQNPAAVPGGTAADQYKDQDGESLKVADGQENTISVANQTAVPEANRVPTASASQQFAQDQFEPAGAAQNIHPAKDSITIPLKAKLSTAEFLLAESKTAVKKEKKKTALSKWDFGLQVMPTATRTKMNFGGGVITAYHLSDKLSLSSGITLLQLGSGENVPEATAVMAANAPAFSTGSKTAQGNRQLLSVNGSISAIDIPLGIVYKVNKHYFTSAGVSYFNVLTEKRNNTYAEVTPVSRVSTDPSTGAIESYTALETQEVDEPATEQPLRGNSYLGFFNFSIGRRQNIFKQYNIQIEPFIKVPIGKLSTQDLNLMNSGVKFQFSF